MFTEKNFKSALDAMNFEKVAENFYQNNFGMAVDFNEKKLFYPKNLKVHRDSIKNFSQNENFVVFECVNRLLQKNYQPQDIEIEKPFKLGHTQKSGRADICVSQNQKILFIIECKTFGAEFDKELKNILLDGGQLFSYRQQEISCEWLILYASDISDKKIIFNSKSISCHEEIYKSAKNVQDFFKIWSEKFNKNLADDVIFHDETVAYKIGVPPFRKKNLIDFPDTSIVNIFEEILRHNSVTNKQNAFDALLELFICKLVDENNKNFNQELDFQFKFGSDDYEIFIDRLQKLYQIGMEEFMNIPVTYIPLTRIDELLFQSRGEGRNFLKNSFKEDYKKLKFYTPNSFNFVKVLNPEIFYQNTKIVVEVVNAFKNFKIIGAKNLQILGDLFEQLLDKGFKQDEGQFFTPLPITRFIWDSLPLEKIIISEKFLPKIIDYACGAGHFLTQGFEAIKDFQKNLPEGWENEKIFGVEKNDRLSFVSKISFFMHGVNKGKIKCGDGLENFADEGIFAESFDILVSNPPYSIKDFKQHLKLENKFEILEKISKNGSEIETLFVERISQLLKCGGIAAVILPSSILNKDGGSFICAREKILQNFYVRAIAEFGSKTFSATGTKTNILFLEKISPKEKYFLNCDAVNEIFSGNFTKNWSDEKIFDAWLKKIKIEKILYEKFLRREKAFFDWKNDAYFGEYFQKFVDSMRSARDFLEKYGEELFVY
ncbi:MAG: restriction endonuclease subunit M, partial [Selenomonadaceae bacterium]|nr:restriction endonuclease subunit M [Selenomonadaceae bacterium]